MTRNLTTEGRTLPLTIAIVLLSATSAHAEPLSCGAEITSQNVVPCVLLASLAVSGEAWRTLRQILVEYCRYFMSPVLTTASIQLVSAPVVRDRGARPRPERR